MVGCVVVPADILGVNTVGVTRYPEEKSDKLKNIAASDNLTIYGNSGFIDCL